MKYFARDRKSTSSIYTWTIFVSFQIPSDTDLTRCSEGEFQIIYSVNKIQTTVRVGSDTRRLNISSLAPCTDNEFRVRAANYGVEGSTSYSSPANVKILVGKLIKLA